ncbi:hypothetical protein FGL74_00990 [Leuconostoc koreense]|nr:hypothetical protein FGL74_00990 [Leuconostoc mesenteroides]QGM25888.1 hypothetical protein GJV51_07830 [Leuconostoc mesenteroides subsp. mesenteroides]
MKVPIYSPIEQLRDHVMKLQNKAMVNIANFRKNVLKNRDDRRKRIAKLAKTREISIVPYESTARAVDTNSFAYALEASITESATPQKKHFTISYYVKNFFYHPLRVLSTVIILILLVYIAIMFSKAVSTNQHPITETRTHQSKNTK